VLRILITLLRIRMFFLHFDEDPDPTSHFDADPNPIFHFNEDLDHATLTNVMRLRICDHWSTDQSRSHLDLPAPIATV
jgi:hypothetical protein